MLILEDDATSKYWLILEIITLINNAKQMFSFYTRSLGVRVLKIKVFHKQTFVSIIMFYVNRKKNNNNNNKKCLIDRICFTISNRCVFIYTKANVVNNSRFFLNIKASILHNYTIIQASR